MKELLLQNFDYEQWANLQVIKSLQLITNPPEKAEKIMAHILSAQKVWFESMEMM